MKKKVLLALVILLVATGCGKVPQLSNGEEAIVSFDNEKLSISADVLFNELKDKYALNVLIDLIDRSILLDKYPDKEEDAKEYIKEQLDGVKEYYKDEKGKYDEAALIEALTQYYGISTIEEFEKMLELTYYRMEATEDYAESKVTKKQIEKYYKDEVVGDIECKHILITSKATDKMTDEEKKAAEDKALKTAKDIIKKLDKGESFDDLAKKHSEDKANSETGGDLGYFNKGKMLASFEKAAYALKVNAYTKKPVKTEYGYHIILKTGEKDKASLEDSREEIITKLGKDIQTSDNTIAVNGLADLRKEYGIKIEDSNLKTKYSTYISNQLLSLRQQEENK